MPRLLVVSLHLPLTAVPGSHTSFGDACLEAKSPSSVASAEASYTFPRSSSSSSGSTKEQLQWRLEKSTLHNGGLHNALDSVGGSLGEIIRIGSLGMPPSELCQAAREQLTEQLRAEHSCVPVWIETEVSFKHYELLCKQIIWPTMHYCVPDYPKSQGWEWDCWGAYIQVCNIFLDVILQVYQPGDIGMCMHASPSSSRVPFVVINTLHHHRCP